MAIQFVGGKAVVNNSAGGVPSGTYDLSLTGLTGGLASAPAEDDIVLIASGFLVNFPFGDGVVASYGFTQLAALNLVEYRNVRWSFDYKIMGSTPDSTVKVYSSATTSFISAALVMVYRGVDLTTPFDATLVNSQLANTATPNPAAITTVTDGAEVVIMCFASTHTTEEKVFDISSGYGNIFTDGLYNAATMNDGGLIGAGSINKTTAGVEDPAAFTNITVGRPDRSGAISFTAALRPAAGGASDTTKFFAAF